MRKYLTIVVGVMAVFGLTSCATLFTGSKSKVEINSNMPYADQVSIDGKTATNVAFPYKTKIKNGYKKSTISAEKDGYKPVTVSVDKKMNGVFWSNLLLLPGALPGMLIDAATGSIMKVSKDSYYLTFMPNNNNSTPESQHVIINNTYMVDGSKVTGSGKSSLESTVIRWYIVSSPAGADVQWRVVSSTQDVKNTNQNYLGSTPYESTETFDIMGLTYENSGNVQIEISCEKMGYITQRKRFNIRQAIDQKEISSKFNLVKDE